MLSSWFGVRSVQPGMVVQDGWACAAWVCCSVLIKILINYSTVLLLLNVLLNAAFANEPYIMPSFGILVQLHICCVAC